MTAKPRPTGLRLLLPTCSLPAAPSPSPLGVLSCCRLSRTSSPVPTPPRPPRRSPATSADVPACPPSLSSLPLRHPLLDAATTHSDLTTTLGLPPRPHANGLPLPETLSSLGCLASRGSWGPSAHSLLSQPAGNVPQLPLNGP